MGRSHKPKRVSWASDLNLCQVRLFSCEESPSQVVLGTQNHHQEKAMWSHGNQSDDNLPPGFERIEPSNMWRLKLPQIPLIKWGRPRTFEINVEWQVVAGEESKEVETQKQREMRVLEAVYPRPSSIPPNPFPLVGIENSLPNEQNIPLIPINPIEDDDFSLDTSFGSPTANPNLIISQTQIPSHGTHSRANGISPNIIEPNMLASAQAALTSILSSTDHKNNLVDPDLLIKILSDPKMVEQLVTKIGASPSPQNVSSSIGIQNVTSISTQNNPLSEMHNIPNLRPPTNTSMAKANGPFYPPHVTPGHHPNLRPLGPPVAKDVNYYKSLIQQHGEEKRDGLSQFGNQSNVPMRTGHEQLNYAKSRESKPKIMKACIYFKSSKGCRNGANCAFQHDTSTLERVNGVPEVHNAKRVKLD